MIWSLNYAHLEGINYNPWLIGNPFFRPHVHQSCHKPIRLAMFVALKDTWDVTCIWAGDPKDLRCATTCCNCRMLCLSLSIGSRVLRGVHCGSPLTSRGTCATGCPFNNHAPSSNPTENNGKKKTAELERFIYDIFRRDKKGSRTPCRPYWRNVKKSRRKRTVMQVHSKYSNRKERITEFVGMNKTPYFMIHLSST